MPDPEFVETSGAFVVTFQKSKLTREYLEGLGLTERQVAAVEFVRQKERITNHEYAQLVGVAGRTATRDLTALVEKKVFRQTGKGKGSYFTLA